MNQLLYSLRFKRIQEADLQEEKKKVCRADAHRGPLFILFT